MRSLANVRFRALELPTYLISGPRKDGRDSLYATHVLPVVDDDVIEEYWLKVRGRPIPAKNLKPMQSDAGVPR